MMLKEKFSASFLLPPLYAAFNVNIRSSVLANGDAVVSVHYAASGWPYPW